ncbi:phytoene synthase [Sulfolobales archaeon HS-7]|nr:phytoene synthase [Sulfolobales archaeon HS-7]
MVKELTEIFRRSSTTYYNSTLLFPKRVKEDVTKLYAFVRVFDDLVDSIPQRVKEFYELREVYYSALYGRETSSPVISNFVELMRRKSIDEKWVEAFLNSMESDIYKGIYHTIDETLSYIYGSAEVVGLMMMRILSLDEKSQEYAKMLGRAMQYLNFIRDFQEDQRLGRQYLPFDEMIDMGVSLEEGCTKEFKEFIRLNVNRYMEYQKEAEKGYRFIPSRFLIPIKTASDMYKWTGKIIYSDPCVVYRVKVKPRRSKVIASGLLNAMRILVWLPYFSHT